MKCRRGKKHLRRKNRNFIQKLGGVKFPRFCLSYGSTGNRKACSCKVGWRNRAGRDLQRPGTGLLESGEKNRRIVKIPHKLLAGATRIFQIRSVLLPCSSVQVVYRFPQTMIPSSMRLFRLSHIAATVVSVATASASSVVLRDVTLSWGTSTQTVNSSDSFLVSPDLQSLVTSLPSSGVVVLSTASDTTSLLPLSDVGAGVNVLDSTYSGSLSLIKAGAGTLTLSESNTYTGGMTVSGGTLSLGYGTLGGSGFIGGATSSASGVLTPGGSASIRLNLGSATLTDWTRADPLTAFTGGNAQINLPNLSSSGYGGNISTVGTTGSAATLSVIPEPGGGMLGSLGLLALLRRRRA